MNILFLTRLYMPHIGGVEKHAMMLNNELLRRRNHVTVITQNYSNKLPKQEIDNGSTIIRISPPKVKYLGLLYIWYWLLKNSEYIKKADIVHCHDVFIWYLPFRFLYFRKPVFTTFHGWEGEWPVPLKNILFKRIAAKYSWGSISIGEYIEKYYHIKTNKVLYGGAVPKSRSYQKVTNNIVYVGRLEEDTGLPQFLDWLKKHKGYDVDFCGDGRLKDQCLMFGKVYGFVDPTHYYDKAKYLVPGGYLSALEGLRHDCVLKLYWNSALKQDYWKLSPFYKLKGVELIRWSRKQTWTKIADEYISLYKSVLK